MPFNSNTYHRNKARREAKRYIMSARDAKVFQHGSPDRGAADVQHYVRLARLQWRTYLSYLRIKRCDDDMKALRAGRITHEVFMERWCGRSGSPSNGAHHAATAGHLLLIRS